MYYGAEDIFEHLEYIAYADEEAYYSNEGSRELTDASARLQQYTDDFNYIGSIIEDLEYEMTETFSDRQIGYLEEEIEYYQYTREEIEALEWNT
jgi:secreted Zn-dependent insulinase-like peptidase